MRGLDFIKAALMLAGAYMASYITGGKIPYFVFYICLGVLSFDLVWAAISVRITACSWTEANSIQAGARVKVFTEIKNHSGWPLPWVQCWIEMPQTFGLPDNMCCYTFSLGPHETRVVIEEMDSRTRGKFRWGQCFIRTGGISGFFTNTRTSGKQSEIEVIPTLYNIVGLDGIKTGTYGKITGSLRSVRENTGIISVRNYSSSDGISRIHWKNSARFGKLMVKESQQVNPVGYMLLLDNCIENHVGEGPNASFEKAVTLAASVTVSAYKTGNGISLTLYRGDTGVNTSIKNSCGRDSLNTVLSILTVVELKENISNEMWKTIDLSKSKGSRLIWITGYLDSNAVENRIRKRELCSDSIVFLLTLETFGKVEFNLDERHKAVNRLRGIGIQVIKVDKDTDLRLVMGRALYGIS